MEFGNKYTITAGEKYTYKDETGKEVSVDKILISKDAYAQAEVIDNLIKRIEVLFSLHG